jgi:hypothetical protein
MPKVCKIPGCKKSALYNFPGLPHEVCGDAGHRQEGMVNTVTKRCEKCIELNLPNPPITSMGFPGKPATMCSKHAEEGMVIRRGGNPCVACVESGKLKAVNAHFGFPGGKPTHCSECSKKVPGMVSFVKQLKCKTPDCEGRRVYGPPGGKAAFCRACRDNKVEAGESMVNTYARKCEECKLRAASCGLRGGRLTHCRTCGGPKGLVGPDYVMCRGCNVVAGTFWEPGKSGMKYCASCYDPSTMVDPYRMLCVECGTVRRSCNFPGLPAMYCAACRTEGMVNVSRPRCAVEGCDIIPSMGQPGKRGTHCFAHGTDLGLVHVNKLWCDHESHDTNGPIGAGFGILGTKATRCSCHRDNGMIYKPSTRCAVRGCNSLGTIQDPRSAVTRYCDRHVSEASEGSYALVTDKCVICGLVDVLDGEGNCPTCDPNRLRHSKELRIRDVLDDTDDLCDYVHDRSIGGLTALLERPDFLFVLPTHIVIVEVDEYQHTHGYTPECDRARMINISQAVAMPTTFIRYNPDSYSVAGKKGDAVSHKREEALVAHVRAAMNVGPLERDAYLEVVYLFYDENDQRYQTLTPMEA